MREATRRALNEKLILELKHGSPGRRGRGRRGRGANEGAEVRSNENDVAGGSELDESAKVQLQCIAAELEAVCAHIGLVCDFDTITDKRRTQEHR